MMKNESLASNDTNNWRKTAAAVAITFAIATPGGTVMASEAIESACGRRNTYAPGGQASPAELCEKNDSLRAVVAEFVGRLMPDTDPRIFEDHGLSG